MLYLLLAILSSAMVSITMRLSEKHITNKMAMFMSNYAICIALSAFFMNWNALMQLSGAGVNGAGISAGANVAGQMLAPAIILGIISGVLYLVNFVLLKYSMHYNGVVMSSTFMKLGVLIPTIMAVVVFREIPRWTQIFGIGLALTAIVINQFEKDALKESNKKIWLLMLLVLSGLTDSMANIYEQIGAAEAKDGYLLVTFFTAFLVAVVFALLEKRKMTVKDILFGLLIGIPNYFSARFLLLALGSLDAVLVYPMYSVATIIVVTIVGIAVFHEKLSKKKAGALALIAIAVCLLNL